MTPSQENQSEKVRTELGGGEQEEKKEKHVLGKGIAWTMAQRQNGTDNNEHRNIESLKYLLNCWFGHDKWVSNDNM